MYKESDFTQAIYTTGEVAKLLGVTPMTIINKDKEGLIPFKRSDTNRRIIGKDDLVNYLDSIGLLYRDNNRCDVIYARVSTNRQKERGDLERQVMCIIEYAKDKSLTNLKIITEVGSGLNDNRKELNKLLKLILEKKVRRLFINYKDRLTRFGYNYIEEVCNYNGAEIITVSNETQNKTVQEELAEDLVAIIHSFSGKLYGLRQNVKKEIQAEIEKLSEGSDEVE